VRLSLPILLLLLCAGSGCERPECVWIENPVNTWSDWDERPSWQIETEAVLESWLPDITLVGDGWRFTAEVAAHVLPAVPDVDVNLVGEIVSVTNMVDGVDGMSYGAVRRPSGELLFAAGTLENAREEFLVQQGPPTGGPECRVAATAHRRLYFELQTDDGPHLADPGTFTTVAMGGRQVFAAVGEFLENLGERSESAHIQGGVVLLLPGEAF